MLVFYGTLSYTHIDLDNILVHKVPLRTSNLGLFQDEGFSEYRSLFTNLLDSEDPQFSLTKRMQQVAGPAMQTLGDAAAKLIQ